MIPHTMGKMRKKIFGLTLRIGETPQQKLFFKILLYDFLGVIHMYTHAEFHLSSIKDLGAKPRTDRQTDGHGETIRVPFLLRNPKKKQI